jgi:CheY-like chemotaxis protein
MSVRLYDLNNLSVLVIDDNAHMRTLVMNLLDALNLRRVVQAEGCHEALTAMASTGSISLSPTG